MNPLILNNNIYRLHPVYDLYGADVDGNIIDIIKKVPINDDRKMRTIIVRKVKGMQPKQYKTDVFVWESHNGIKPRGMIITHVNKNEEDNRIDNLRLEKELRKSTYNKQPFDEQKYRNVECLKRWRDREWICQKCGAVKTNNTSRHHKRICPFTDKSFTEEEKENKKMNDKVWSKKMFKCSKCGKQYRNNYKSIHSRKCHSQEE